MTVCKSDLYDKNGVTVSYLKLSDSLQTSDALWIKSLEFRVLYSSVIEIVNYAVYNHQLQANCPEVAVVL